MNSLTRGKMVQVTVVSRRPSLLRRSSPLVSEKTSGIQGKMLANLSKESFFQLFRREICRLQVGNFLRENGDHVPKFGGSNLQIAGRRSQVAVIVSPIQKVS